MAYTQVSKGSSGNSVAELQRLLNQNGYSLDEDGIFGDKTLAAVKDYQNKNGLTVDGIVGNKTWTSLSGTTGSTGSNNGAASEGFTYNAFAYDDYEESDTVKAASAALQSQINAKPGAYSSQWQGQINDMIDRILNREKFTYDVNSDALYQQYKDQYSALGKLAMQDTMGQAAGMTGGYGNSYAVTAGNQAYQQYLSKLNEVVPELYGMARDQYNQEGQELYNQYGLLSDQEDKDYGRYMDAYNQWASERDYLAGRYDSERNYDYSKYTADRNFAYGQYSDDKSYAYTDYRNQIADEQWQAEQNLRENADKREAEAWALEQEAYNDSKKSYTGTTETGTSYNNGSLTNAQVKELQTALGVDADGYYGPASKKAAGGLSAADAYAKYVAGSTEGGQPGAKTSNVTSAMESKAAEFESNDALANWAYGLADAGTITEDEADALIATYMDHNEKYVDKDDGSKSISYSNMIKSANGWSVVNDGGTNWFWGVDGNAVVKAPNGEKFTMDKLKEILESEGMSGSEAKDWIIELQDILGI